MSGITTHVLDTARGRPASGVPVLLEIRQNEAWREIAEARTDEDGRVRHLLPAGFALIPGIYRLTFGTATYFENLEIEGFYPEAAIVFQVRDANQHHHVPLLLSPYGYSTYRGS
ncbi:MAG: hydroxyisourate hydrolase [Thermoanaerobaculia bacterium]